MIEMIVAVDINNGLGKDGLLAWHVPADLTHFKSYTLGKPVVMGSATCMSLPVRPLPNRKNIVLSRSGFKFSGVIVYPSILELMKNERDFIVIGGKAVYDSMLEYVDRIVISRLHKSYDCDIFLSPIDTKRFHIASIESKHCEISGVSFDVEIWDRV